MYQSIVKELKARGAWEEDEASDAEAEEKDPAAQEELYAQLSEEDRKALALGRELSRKKEEKAKKRRRRRKVFRIAGVAAACLAIVFGVGMTSDANRRLVQRMWDGWMVEFGFKVNTNYTGDEESVRSKSKDEIEAMEAV